MEDKKMSLYQYDDTIKQVLENAGVEYNPKIETTKLA